MGGLLVEHAVANVWCEPIQDRQEITALARLTKNAVSGFVNVLWGRIVLPPIAGLTRPTFHVYQIGALSATLFDIVIEIDTWVNLRDVVVLNNVIIDVFFLNGCKVPLDTMYLRQNKDGNLILAIQYLPRINYLGSDLDNSTLYIRFYANALYDTVAWRATANHPDQPIQVVCQYIKTQVDFTTFITQVNQITALYTQGYGVYYIDGYAFNPLLGFDTSYLGKHLSFIWDSSVKHTQVFNITTLPQFTSDVDPNIVKYLAVMDSVYDTIDYFDDIDVYIKHPVTSQQVFLARLRKETCRQVTHNAYSLSKRNVDDFLTLLNWPVNSSVVFIVRQGGLNRGLFPQHNRIEELYKLSYSQIITAMTTNTVVPEWSARALENSAYIRLMGSSIDTITAGLVEEAYGYNASTKVIANPLMRVNTDSVPFVNLSNLMSTPDKITNSGKRVIYHYKDGLLEGHLNNNALFQDYYLPPTFNDSDTVEAFNANAIANITGILYDQDVTSHRLKQYGFRCYVCALIGGVPSEIWYDVTDGPYHYYNADGNNGNNFTPTLVWDYGLLSAANLFPCVKINDVHYIHTPPTLTPNFRGYIQFELLEDVVWFGTPTTRRFRVPVGVIDVFMDGYSLIQDLDYFVEDGVVTIVKKPYTLPEDTVIFVRAYGSPSPVTMAPDLPREAGFVRAGILSVNGVYDIRNDRNIRVILSGKMKHRDEVKFAENSDGILTTDGKPYAISDYALPVENFTTKTLIPYRTEALDLDERVMNYMTTLLPEPTIPNGVIHVERWELVSPFCSAILHALLNGFLSTGQLDMNYTDSQVDGWLVNYLPLLSVDPCIRPIDLRYVVIYPHPYNYMVSVTESQYRFMDYLVNRFLFNRTDLTPAVFID